jgi:hypothetical protein
VPPQHRFLVPERQQLSILGQVTAEHPDKEAEYPENYQVDHREQHPASQPSAPPRGRRLRRSAAQLDIRAAQD